VRQNRVRRKYLVGKKHPEAKVSKRFNGANEHPLHWPESFPRSGKPPKSSQFSTTLAKAMDNVENSLHLLAKDSGKKVTDVLISSNYSLSTRRPTDPAVAVYFTFDGEETCIPVERYDKIECNLQAIHHCIEADRTKLRHGGIELVKAAFRGYTALPNPNDDSWYSVMGFEPGAAVTYETARAQYRRLIKQCHPDKGGCQQQAARLNKAWEQAEQQLKPKR
jgi:hypothetical protein